MAAGILAAGGTGLRSGRSTPKQFLPIAGRPLIRWSFDALHEAGCSPVVVVAPGEHVDETRAACGDPQDLLVVPGGETRQASVLNGLQLVETEDVVVHDAARPFAGADLVRRVIEALGEADGAIAVAPVDDTLKEIESGSILRTIDRDRVRRAQTPQAFKTGVLKLAHARALAEGWTATDDSELVERAGGRVVAVESHAANMKITRAEDLEVAASVARSLS